VQCQYGRKRAPRLTSAEPSLGSSFLVFRLELSLKDALKNTFFSSVDELLLQVYYVYEKSPKKSRR
jgi:hypothetical protein